MKALTICQPYAHLIAVIGEKKIENRTYETHYRGPLAIHAGKSRSWLGEDDERLYPDMVFGAVVGVCDLAACVRVDSLRQFARRNWKRWGWVVGHAHAHGPWCWILENVLRLTEPIPWKGAQGLWMFPDSELCGKTLTPVIVATKASPMVHERQEDLPLFQGGTA